MTLDEHSISKLLQKDSPFFDHQKQFEERPEQIEMLQAIVKAFNEKTFAFIEAGTGIGKSLAYLLPAILNGIENDGRCVISTHTITLQEQLLQKDIPFILKTLGYDLSAVLVKGMGNYLCLRKYYDLLDHASLQSVDQQTELAQLEDWIQTTSDGSLSDLETTPKKIGWEKLNCESDACSFVKCPQYSNCFFFKARKKCKDAKILVANHHLLLADLQMADSDGQNGILPEYEHLIIDEAHTLEDIATRSLATSVSAQYILRKLNELVAERGGSGKLQRLKKVLIEHEDSLEQELIEQVCDDLFAEKRLTQSLLFEAYIALGDFLDENCSNSSSNDGKIALDAQMRSHPEFENIKTFFVQLSQQIKGFTQSLASAIERCSEISNSQITKKLQNIIIDTKSLINFFEKTANVLQDFFNPEENQHKVYVIEWNSSRSLSGIRMLIIQLNVSEILATNLFSPRSSATLCSATLSHNKEFAFAKKQLGFQSEELKSRGLVEKLLESPFDYKEKVLLATPSNMPDPRTPNYNQILCENIVSAVKTSQGGAFILFTSYNTLGHCYDKIAEELISEGLLPLRQGDENRNTLLKIFKENSNSVLFGTDTFWEGIDVPGFNLRLVIITKLPFPVPSEPIFQAKCKQLEAEGKSSFMEYSVPKAIVKFKQGFGRLIRTKNDFGTILCFDSRLINKAYGRLFINSLPKCKRSFEPFNKVLVQMQKFYDSNREWSVTESNR